MKHSTGKTIMGAALSLAAIGVVVDYTQHPLPEIEILSEDEQQDIEQGTPCGLGAAPCSLGEGTEDDDL